MKISIFPKDVQMVTGYSESYSRKIIRAIKTALCKEKHQLVTVSEFCTYMGFSEVEVRNALVPSRKHEV